MTDRCLQPTQRSAGLLLHVHRPAERRRRGGDEGGQNADICIYRSKIRAFTPTLPRLFARPRWHRASFAVTSSPRSNGRIRSVRRLLLVSRVLGGGAAVTYGRRLSNGGSRLLSCLSEGPHTALAGPLRLFPLIETSPSTSFGSKITHSCCGAITSSAWAV